ncbi:uncharacterized protein EI90DRAFT_252729 [Cantharellus anzutake]|uniref:uncharacterized protein n=1 Tax=Cantharellus anzutake TaxID=1750568 RepID=UPI0019040A48|nr:uncharacterized protein EI90DRAFT_252729 [Cantharellus anzutake]KAF8335767.1 hypothetical protein EI90DRAFT_252729 [Cantharellus anzutake]
MDQFDYNTLCIRNINFFIPRDVAIEGLWELASQYGEVKGINVPPPQPPNPERGNRGYGFVSYRHPAAPRGPLGDDAARRREPREGIPGGRQDNRHIEGPGQVTELRRSRNWDPHAVGPDGHHQLEPRGQGRNEPSIGQAGPGRRTSADPTTAGSSRRQRGGYSGEERSPDDIQHQRKTKTDEYGVTQLRYSAGSGSSRNPEGSSSQQHPEHPNARTVSDLTSGSSRGAYSLGDDSNVMRPQPTAGGSSGSQYRNVQTPGNPISGASGRVHNPRDDSEAHLRRPQHYASGSDSRPTLSPDSSDDQYLLGQENRFNVHVSSNPASGPTGLYSPYDSPLPEGFQGQEQSPLPSTDPRGRQEHPAYPQDQRHNYDSGRRPH